MAEENEFATPQEVYSAYSSGELRGWVKDIKAKADFCESQKYQYFSEPNIQGSGIGKKALLWNYTRQLDPGAFTEKQKTGDCVSHGSRNCRDIARSIQLLVNGQAAQWLARGATEPTYGSRGHGGQGMSPAGAARFERDVGFLARKKYDACDLSQYAPSLGIKWGSAGVPSAVKDLCGSNKVGLISPCRKLADLIDALFNGYPCHSGQYAAWEPEPNKQNIHRRASPGWHHDMCTAGYDDTKTHWPFTVFFIINSWGNWNEPVKDWPAEYGPWIPGMIVTNAEDYSVCVDEEDMWIYGQVDGYPPQALPNFGAIGNI